MKNLLITLVMLISSESFSQKFHYDKFFGVTVDSSTGKALESVKIIAKDSQDKVLYEKTSDSQGNFELNTNTDKIHTISFIHSFYKPFIVDMTRTVFGVKSFDTVFLAYRVKNMPKPLVVNITSPNIRQKSNR